MFVVCTCVLCVSFRAVCVSVCACVRACVRGCCVRVYVFLSVCVRASCVRACMCACVVLVRVRTMRVRSDCSSRHGRDAHGVEYLKLAQFRESMGCYIFHVDPWRVLCDVVRRSPLSSVSSGEMA